MSPTESNGKLTISGAAKNKRTVDPSSSQSEESLLDYKKLAEEAMEEALAAKARLEHLLASGSGVIFSCVPTDGNPITFISDSVKVLLGYEPQELIDRQGLLLDIVHPDDREEISTMLEYLCEVGHLVHDIRVRHKDGSYRWLRNELRADPHHEGKAREIIGHWLDITQYKFLEEQLLHDAFHDPLTNLPNRALFMDRLGISFSRLRRQKSYLFAVLFIDLDRFKNVNDSLGHIKGDQLLLNVAMRLQRCIRFGDTVARLGGDEFAIVLNDIKDLADAEATVRRIQRDVGLPYNLDGTEVFASASIGIAICHPRYRSPEHILRDADTAMYRAKASGRARHLIFNESMREQAVSLLELETDLRKAVDRNEFILHYQPVYDLKAREVIGFEALLRWKHPSRGMIRPGRFISMAEDMGLIVPIGRWALREACRQVRDWQKRFPQDPPLDISVNLSNKQLMPEFTAEVRDILKATGLDPSTLKFEITESTVIQNLEWAADLFKELGRMKVRVLIDDFGTGYSSMNYLSKLPVNGLKIDRSFIHAMTSGSGGLEIVKTILSLARSLGLEVIAEGVETPEQLRLLEDLDGEYAQGFFFNEPVNESRIEGILALQSSRRRGLMRCRSRRM